MCYRYLPSILLLALFPVTASDIDTTAKWKVFNFDIKKESVYDCEAKVWPRVELFLPVFLKEGDKRIDEWKEVFLRSFLLFWPIKTSDVSLHLFMDKDVEGTEVLKEHVLQPVEQYSKALGVNFPPVAYTYSDYVEGTYRTGHDRNQYYMFVADSHVKAEYVGFVDTDSVFHTYVDREDLFEGRKPIIHGRLRPYYHHHEQQQALSTFEALGLLEPMICMSYFPIIIKTAHLKEIREYIVKHMGMGSFNEAFFKFSERGVAMYSQFNIMCAYLWYHRRDDYAWYVHDTSPWWDGLTNPEPTPGRIGDKRIFNESMFYPKVYVAGHLYARSNPQEAYSKTVNMLAGGLCWRYPNTSIIMLDLPAATEITKHTLEKMGPHGSKCRVTYMKDGLFDQNHIFEESHDWLMYDMDTLREADKARRDSLARCQHTYVLI